MTMHISIIIIIIIITIIIISRLTPVVPWFMHYMRCRLLELASTSNSDSVIVISNGYNS